MSIRSDNLLTTLGSRSSGLRRLWVEDSFSRLSDNGFEIGTGFVVEPRMGPGLNLRPSGLGSCHVSQRRGAAILSYEGSTKLEQFAQPEIRVKISHALVQVLPSLRAFTVRTVPTGVWTIDGQTISTPEGRMTLRTGHERPAGRPATIEARLDSMNLVAATDFIAWAKPGTIRLLSGSTPVIPMGQLDLFAEPTAASVESTGDSAITQEVARQFFVACGWEQTEPGVFHR